MDVYQYIAANNPYIAKTICHKYGYNVTGANSAKDLAYCMHQLVAEEGEPAFKDIMMHHPDKDVIVEMFGTPSMIPSLPVKEAYSGFNGAAEQVESNVHSCRSGCNCSAHRNHDMNYRSADAMEVSSRMSSASTTALALVGGAIILAAAIIVNNK